MANLDTIAKKISEMLNDKELYKKLSNNALAYSRRYDEGAMRDAITELI